MDKADYSKVPEEDMENQGEFALPKSERRYTTVVNLLKSTNFRVMLELWLLVISLLLLFIGRTQRCGTQRSSNLKTMPNFTLKQTLFQQDFEYANVEAFTDASKLNDTLKAWTALLPKHGRGTIVVEPSDRLGLTPPYSWPLLPHEQAIVKQERQDVYMMSVFHQIHCLSTLLYSYGRLMIDGQRPIDLDHDVHCFDYIRQGLICSSDLTVEGFTDYGDGWGSTHKCMNMEEIKAWTEEHAGLKFRSFPDHI